jgi:hypothetical protein
MEPGKTLFLIRRSARAGGEIVGFQFKPKLAAVLAVLNGASVGLAYIVSQGNITATTIWFAITTGAIIGLSYYKEKE